MGQRGKISLYVEWQTKKDSTTRKEINKELMKQYVEELNNAAHYVSEVPHNVFGIALNMPDVMVTTYHNDSTEEEWKLLLDVLNETIDQFDQCPQTFEGRKFLFYLF